MAAQYTVVHWFRKGLRVHDNPALKKALTLTSDNSEYVLRPVYFLDQSWPELVDASANRWRFLQQTLVDLDEHLRLHGSRFVTTND